MTEPDSHALGVQLLDTVDSADARGDITFSADVLIDLIELSTDGASGLVGLATRRRADKRSVEVQGARSGEPAGAPYERRGIRVRMADGVIDADLAVIVQTGASVLELGHELQSRVGVAVGRMLGMRVGEVNVRVVQVRPEMGTAS